MTSGVLWARRAFVALAASCCAYYTHSAQAGTAVLEAPLASLNGKGLVVHAQPDDEKSDPAGNSGARVACGVVK